ncbi:uncharacterized protein [Ptychodera flava]|uniref:uncharacterized protein n=1 Tax=Ptychodera flava TaxID=63121 RepID=UPI00396A26D5
MINRSQWRCWVRSKVTLKMADQTVDSLLASLASMGFEMDQCQGAVQAGKLTVQDAVDWILQGGQGGATIPVMSQPSQQSGATLVLPIGQRTVSLAPDPPNTSTIVQPSSKSPVSPATSPSPSTEEKFRLQDVHSRFTLGEDKQKEKDNWYEKQRKQAAAEAKGKRMAEKMAKDQILKEIAADRQAKAEKSRKVSPEKSEAQPVTKPETAKQGSERTPDQSDSCMLQIRLPSGQSLRQSFHTTSTLGEVLQSVRQQNRSLSNIGFMQPFPRREFTASEMTQTLKDLGLTPNGSLVVKRIEGPPSKVLRPDKPSGSQSDPLIPTLPSPPPPPRPPASSLGPVVPPQPAAPHRWGAGQQLSSPERQVDEDDEGEGSDQDPYMMMEEGGEEEEGENSDEDENIAVPGAMGGWHPPPAPVGLFGPPSGPSAHQWGEGQPLQSGGPGRGSRFDYGFGHDDEDASSAQRAAAAALQRFERAKQEQPTQKSSGSAARGMHTGVQSLTQACVGAVAKRISRQQQHPLLNLGALPLDVAARILSVMIKEGTLRPKTLQPFLSCRLRKLILDCYKYTTNELLHAVRLHTNLVNLSLCSCPLINDVGLAPLTSLKKLKHLNLSSCKQLTDKIIYTIKEFRHLETLSLEETSITDRGIQEYVDSKPSNLTQLNLNRTAVTDRTLQALTDLSKLTVLGLERTQISDLASLRSLTNLQALNISGTELPATSLVCLRELPALMSLNISQTQNMNGDEALKCLEGLKLSELQLPSRLTTTDRGLQYIADMPLVTLDLTDYIHITDEGVRHISNLHSLQVLSLSNTKVTDAAMTSIQGLTRLVELDLDRTSISNAGAAIIGKFTDLQVLGLASTRITSKLLTERVLNRCIMLNKLNLSRTRVKDKGLEALELPYLTLINLDGTYVSVNAMEHLSSCPQLRVVRMQNLVPRELWEDDGDDGE